MNKYNSFEELKNARLKAYNAMRDGDVLGFLDQHTGFYSDHHAHFIYELLQNAEDMEATEVSFKLFPDKLIFEHNGTKRDFTLDDIDAITNKGKSPKADDPTQIGKFGMGFKAVYVYTNTPEIHSGEYDFRIENVIVPNNEGVSKTAKANLTQFIFPFDNPNMPAQTAVERIIKDGFEKLNETSLLFLTHIKTIRYCRPDGGTGYISIENKISNIYFICAITVKKPNSEKIVTYWAKFSDNCSIMVNSNDSHNKAIKEFPVSIAYRLNKNENNFFSLDSSLVGKVCLFFPTEMDSLLHFHINAPFASTVARNVIQSTGEDGEANTKLIRKLADLTAESLHLLKKAKMLDYAAYSTLPSLRDYNNQPDSRYKIFASRIKEEFENNELFIADNSNYYAIKDVFKADNKDIKTILPTKFVEKIYHKSWIPTVPSETRVKYFIDQFKIAKYSIENFIDSLENNNNCFDELFSDQKDVEYFKTLYYQFSQSKETSKYNWLGLPISRNEILNDVKLILCEDKKLHSAKENIYLRTDYQPKYLKNPIYVDLPLKNTDTDREIKPFLLSVGVKEMSEKEDTKIRLSTNDGILDVWHDILKKFDENPDTILSFKDQKIFFANKTDDPTICNVCASDCCWSKEVSFFYHDKFVLAKNCYVIFEKNILKIKEIFTKLGGKTEPTIKRITYIDNDYPLYNLLKKERERSDTCRQIDYIIDEFDLKNLNFIKSNALKKESLVLWRFVLKCNAQKYLNIYYQPNSSAKPQNDLDSSLVYYLKRTAWIPTKSGKYKYPYELTNEDLLDDFKYEKPSLLLSAISEKPNDIVEQLKRTNIKDENTLFYAECSKEEQEIGRRAIERSRLQQKSGKSLTEVADTSDREQLPEDDEFNEDIDSRRIKNFERRKLKLEKGFDEREEIPTSVKKLRFVTEKPNDDEKTFVRNEYHARCQLCGSEGILTAKGKRYFEAVNIFNTAQLDESLKIKFNLGWNTLSLCPNCAAKFKYSQLKISGFIAQVESIDISAVQNEFIEIPIVLEEKPTKIRFTPKHLLALQVAIKKLKEIELQNNH